MQVYRMSCSNQFNEMQTIRQGILPLLHTTINRQTSLQQDNQMQYLKQSQPEPTQPSLTLTILTKTLIALTRIALHSLSINYNNFPLSSLTLHLTLPILIYLLLALPIYYHRYGCTSPNQPYSLPLTIAAHLYGLCNMVLAGCKVCLMQHQPRQMFFQIFFGEMVNYMLTLVVLHQLFTTYLVKHSQDFLKIYQPGQKSMVYLFIAYSIGIFCDLIAFAQTALTELYIFAGIALLYLTVRSLFFGNLKTRIKKLFAQ